MKKSFFVLVITAFLSCNNKQDELRKPDFSTIKHQNLEISYDIQSIIKNTTLLKDTLVTIEMDPVYHKKKVFQAIDAIQFLKTSKKYNQLITSQIKIIFECEDGYKPEMPLNLFVKSHPFIASRDLEFSENVKWGSILKQGVLKKLAPFYIVYPKENPNNTLLKWPYNLIKIHLEPISIENDKLYPKNKANIVGYKLFKNYCITCHAINGIGGTLGPELNHPKSVTSYWKENDLVNYICNPASYRDNVKMPNLNLNKLQSKEIVTYLKEISAR